MGRYHAGSRAVQDRVGVRERADHVGASIGEGIKPVAAAFLGLQPLLVVGAADPSTGEVWASALHGPPGFVRATGPRQMSVTAGAAASDPLAPALTVEGTRVGTIALDPRTRRRMRLNGRLRPTDRGFVVTAEQVFSNCPKYLQKRESYEVMADRTGEEPRHGTELTASQAEFITTSDTFFLATVHPGGADASHRGGNPGFVQVASPRELSWRDYPGNSMFLSLGNLDADPRAGLLFLDWTTGTTLQLTGEARTEFAGTERRVRFTVTKTVERPSALPLRWTPPEYSPANPDDAG
ncbi:pyridoxamine 5'-phosphate oxidase family protein [Streptomyces justiciae]|uniref:pyridoxamine 5'-phosphate oxidase family protein n=1 Tax=Streptomyces justiciae TaxID=2780140 RepID=UPI002117A5D1|nr:pyridoxamine 5'-phosphate oxidase family protein [Streptomyces justiciae]MCW8380071.1 pyridoxamine 5'-phosphate oxidase family protein [Streptomyces justiciae]